MRKKEMITKLLIVNQILLGSILENNMEKSMENLYTDTRVLGQNKVMYYHTIFCWILQSAVNAFLDSNVSKGRHGGKGNPIMVSRVSNYSF